MLKYFEDDLEMVLNNTKEHWSELKDKTILVTGGTGFFGIWLLMSFLYINIKLKLNSKIILLTRDKNKFLKKHDWVNSYREVSFLEGDILSFVFMEEPVDYIIHAATEASIKLNALEPLTMYETITNGTKRVLELAKNKNVKAILLTSSGAVYGKQPPEIENISEDYLGAPLISDPLSMYGEGKRMAELLCAIYHKHDKIPVKIARCYAFLGPYLPLDTHFAAGNFIKNLIQKEDIIIDGDGTPYRSYMYAADLVVWLWTVLFKGENNRPYNIGSDKPITISNLANLIADDETKVIIKSPISNQPALRYVPDINRAKNELGLKIYTDLEVCIKKTVEHNKRLNFN